MDRFDGKPEPDAEKLARLRTDYAALRLLDWEVKGGQAVSNARSQDKINEIRAAISPETQTELRISGMSVGDGKKKLVANAEKFGAFMRLHNVDVDITRPVEAAPARRR